MILRKTVYVSIFFLLNECSSLNFLSFIPLNNNNGIVYRWMNLNMKPFFVLIFPFMWIYKLIISSSSLFLFFKQKPRTLPFLILNESNSSQHFKIVKKTERERERKIRRHGMKLEMWVMGIKLKKKETTIMSYHILTWCDTFLSKYYVRFSCSLFPPQ